MRILPVCVALGVAALVAPVIPPVMEVYQSLNRERMQDQSAENLKELGHALERYVKAHHGTLPPLQDAEAAKAALLPHTTNPSIFVHPDTKEPYLPNPFLSGKKMKEISTPEWTVAFYETRRYDGLDFGRIVLCLDGHLVMSGKAGPPDLKRASGIP